MSDAAPWVAPLVEGVLALALGAILFALARVRFARKGGPGAGADVGLD